MWERQRGRCQCQQRLGSEGSCCVHPTFRRGSDQQGKCPLSRMQPQDRTPSWHTQAALPSSPTPRFLSTLQSQGVWLGADRFLPSTLGIWR